MRNFSIDIIWAKIQMAITAIGGWIGYFVGGVDGLIHISQIADRKLASPSEVLKKGQVVDAMITDIDRDNHKVSLSIRALLGKDTGEATQEDIAAYTVEDKTE